MDINRTYTRIYYELIKRLIYMSVLIRQYIHVINRLYMCIESNIHKHLINLFSIEYIHVLNQPISLPVIYAGFKSNIFIPSRAYIHFNKCKYSRQFDS